MKNFKKSHLTLFCSALKRVKYLGVFLFLVAFISLSCKQPTAERQGNPLNVEAKNASTELSMSILPNELGKIHLKNKFIGIVPKKLAESSQEQEIEFYVIDAPTFKFDEFTVEYIQQQKITPKRITSLEQLAGALNSLDLGFNDFVARKVETSIAGGKMTVKDLDNNTTVNCDCPCSVDFGDGVSYGCK